MEAITSLLESLFMNFLFGEEILGLLDKYLINQSDLNKILIFIGVSFLSIIGAWNIVKSILKMTTGLLKVVLLVGIVYYVVVVVMNIDILGMIFG